MAGVLTETACLQEGLENGSRKVRYRCPPMGRSVRRDNYRRQKPRGGCEFWSKVLGVPITSEEGQYLRLGRQGGGPRVILQEVPERKTAKNRVHLDFRVSDVQAALARVEELGGKKIDEDLSDGSVVVVDLDGNELCLVKEISGTPGPGS